MSKGLTLADLPDWPAALNRQQAAAYCGVSVDTFAATCPVQPIAITPARSGQRYLKRRLDEWLNSLDCPSPPKRSGMGALWDAKSEAVRP